MPGIEAGSTVWLSINLLYRRRVGLLGIPILGWLVLKGKQHEPILLV